MALADLTPIEAAGDQRVMVERTLHAASIARRDAASEPGVEREIARHELDWTRLDLAVLELEDQGAAQEAAMCIRVDGSGIDEVAAAARAPVSHMSVSPATSSHGSSRRFSPRSPASWSGPVEEDDQFVLLAVNDASRRARQIRAPPPRRVGARGARRTSPPRVA
jgi:hypothetical protein